MRRPIEKIEAATGIDVADETPREYVDRVLGQSPVQLSDSEAERVRSIVESHQDGSRTLDETEQRELDVLLERLRGAPDRESHERSPPDAPRRRDGRSPASGSDTRHRDTTATANGGQELGTIERAANEPDHETEERSPSPGTRVIWGSVSPRRLSAKVRRHSDVTARLKIEEWAYFTGIVFAWLYIYMTDLGGFDFRIYDETLYAHAARTTVTGGPWIVPHIYYNNWAEHHSIVGYQPFLFKPPLGIWLQSISMTVFGPTKFAARFPSALLMVITALLLYVLARDVYDRHTAGVAAIVFLTVPQLFARHHGGRAATLEIPLLFFGTAFVYATWRAVDRDDPRWLLPMGVAGGLAVLTKGPGAGIFPLVVAPLVVVYWRRFWNASMLKAVGITSALVGTWALYAYVTYGDYFTQVMIVDEVLERTTGSDVKIRDHPKTFSFMKYAYFTRFPFLAEPWAHFLIPAVVFAGVRAIRTTTARLRRNTLFLVWWMGIVFGFFVVTGNHPWYIIPVFVPLSILIGYLASNALDGDWGARVGIVAGVASTLLLSGRLEGTVPTPWARHDVLLDGGLPFLLVIVLVPAAFMLAPTIRRLARAHLSRDYYDVARLVVPALLIVIVTVTLAAPVALHEPYTAEQEELGETATAEVPADAQLYAYDIGKTPIYSFLFFYDDGIKPTDANDINSHGETQYVLTEPDKLQSIHRSYTVLGTAAHPEDEKDTLTLIRVDDRGQSRSEQVSGSPRTDALPV